MNTFVAIGFASSLLSIVPWAHAGIQAFQLGTDAPPTVIGGVEFTPFAPDMQPVTTSASISAVAMDGSDPPSGVTIGFGTPVLHFVVPSTWQSWSHGYTGDVYFSSADTITMLMSPGTQGFRFYAEPNQFGMYPFVVSATSDAGSTVRLTELIEGLAGAKGFAFLADPGESLVSITVTELAFSSYFAVGEFGIALVPGPATLALLGVVGLGRRPAALRAAPSRA